MASARVREIAPNRSVVKAAVDLGGGNEVAKEALYEFKGVCIELVMVIEGRQPGP